jgi:hypothetical protein
MGEMRRPARIVYNLIGPRAFGALEFFIRHERAHGCGGPFNGQRCRAQLFDELIRCRPWNAIVETGTYRGETTVRFEETGIPVYTVESQPRYVSFARTRFFFERRRVQSYFADSREVLGGLASDPHFPRSGIFFYLDAHWYDDLPLRDEVELIFTHWPDSVALVDDFEVPDTAYGFDDYGEGKALTLEYLRPVEHLNLRLFFPTADFDEETGWRRGCVVLCQDEAVARILESVATLKPHIGRNGEPEHE